MKRIFTIALLMICTACVFGQGKQKVAVYVAGKDIDGGKIISSRLISAIAKHRNYQAIERTADFLAELGKEQAYQRSGQVDDRQISKLGRQFGVDLVCVVEITEYGNTYYVDARLVDVETAVVETTSSGNINNFKDIDPLTQVADKMAAELLGVKYRRTLKGFHLTAEAATDGSVWGGNLTLGYRFNTYTALGAGSGFHSYAGENYTGATIPVFAEVRFIMLPYQLSPYATIAGGACFDRYTNTDVYIVNDIPVTKTSDHDAVYGYYNVAVGLQLRCTDVFAIYAGASYNSITNAPTVTAGIAITFVR